MSTKYHKAAEEIEELTCSKCWSQELEPAAAIIQREVNAAVERAVRMTIGEFGDETEVNMDVWIARVQREVGT